MLIGGRKLSGDVEDDAICPRIHQRWGLLALFALLPLCHEWTFRRSEFALVSVRKTRMEEIASVGQRGKSRADALGSSITSSLHAAGYHFEQHCARLGGGAHAGTHCERVLSSLASPFDWLASHSVAGTSRFLLITFLHVILANWYEVLRAAGPRSRRLLVVLPLHIFEIVARPLIWLVNSSGNLFVRLSV